MTTIRVTGPGGAYEVLGVRPGAPPAEVRSAYRRLVRTLHPDVDPAATDRFTAVVDAYRSVRDRSPAVSAGPARHVDVYA